MDFLERFKIAVEKVAGENVEAKAKELGVVGPTLYTYLKGKRAPGVDLLILLKEKTGISLDWLLVGGTTGEDRCASKKIDRAYFEAVEKTLNDFIISKYPIHKTLDSSYEVSNFSELLVETYNFLVDDYPIEKINEGFEKISPFLNFLFTIRYKVDDDAIPETAGDDEDDEPI